MPQRKTLAAIFSPTRRLIGPEPKVVARGGLLGASEWVVPRAQCLYRRLDLAALPPRQRAGAARIAARQHEPVEGAPARIAWTGGIAHLWFWTTPDPAVARSEEAWTPESLVREPPLVDGVRLLRLVEGVEGQYWREGVLQASQYWPQRPSEEQWRRFVRACGLGPDHARTVPEPIEAAWAAPWAESRRAWPGSPARLERWAWIGALWILAVVLGWQVAALARWQDAQRDLQARLETMRARSTPLLAARERAETARDELLRLRELQRGVSDYRLMADIVAALPKGSLLTGWVREGGKLQVTVKSAETDPRAFVAAFEKNKVLADVSATSLPTGAMQLEFTLPGIVTPEARP
ncbi:hypothetical protein ACFOED_08695 [Vulcaniibacterium thermophilum]|uniref:Uncharacterized protein n=1 Tax=Vulcaniibacterium thermophilum TaxID=1169913 RepID=A0A918Z815_9GAMM|nr:hypothetical protein [Vulcaniibacterium thermophilum]GHE41166.1 hypothetical protein GCM10007167_23860 [Vulcaniibacterium thermophilum]